MSEIYLIDYENTGIYGLAGISHLSSDDRVAIFYSGEPKHIAMLKELQKKHGSTFFEFYQLKSKGKDHLDFQLDTYAGYLLGNAASAGRKVIIVSKDHGYDVIVDFWKQYGVDIKRQETIAGISFEAALKCSEEAKKEKAKAAASSTENEVNEIRKSLEGVNSKLFSKQYRKKVRSALGNMKLKPQDYEIIYKAAVKSRTKAEYRIYITGGIEGKKAVNIYGLTRKIVGEFRNASVAIA